VSRRDIERGDATGRDDEVEAVDHDAVAVAQHEPFNDERVLFGHREPPERFERMMSQIR
jgi:hypothetical protein